MRRAIRMGRLFVRVIFKGALRKMILERRGSINLIAVEVCGIPGIRGMKQRVARLDQLGRIHRVRVLPVKHLILWRTHVQAIRRRWIAPASRERMRIALLISACRCLTNPGRLLLMLMVV